MPADRVVDAPGPAVARLRPGLLEGFVPVEQSWRGPRSLHAIDPLPRPDPIVIEAAETWADRETLFGEREG